MIIHGIISAAPYQNIYISDNHLVSVQLWSDMPKFSIPFRYGTAQGNVASAQSILVCYSLVC